MGAIIAEEIRPGVIEILIHTQYYGQAGVHWERVLNGHDNNGYGHIYIQREGAEQRRYWHTRGPRSSYQGNKGIDQDECPGAMFIWTALKYPSVEAVDSIDNQKLGRDMGLALRQYRQGDSDDLWEVTFKFF